MSNAIFLCLPSLPPSRPCDLGKSTPESSPQEDVRLTKPEMFENPLYGSVSSFPKLLPRKEQESPKMLRKDPPPCPDPGILSPGILLPKAQEAEGTKGTGKAAAAAPFLSPTPRLRSYTCSSSAEGRPAAADKSQGKAKAAAGLQAQVPAKRPIKPSRSELSQQPPPPPAQRPPLPVKSPAVLHLQHSKGRDYRENAELPHHGKLRAEDAPLGRASMQVRWGPACAGEPPPQGLRPPLALGASACVRGRPPRWLRVPRVQVSVCTVDPCWLRGAPGASACVRERTPASASSGVPWGQVRVCMGDPCWLWSPLGASACVCE